MTVDELALMMLDLSDRGQGDLEVVVRTPEVPGYLLPIKGTHTGKTHNTPAWPGGLQNCSGVHPDAKKRVWIVTGHKPD